MSQIREEGRGQDYWLIFPGLREVPHLLYADLHSQWRGRHSAPRQDWATSPGLWHNPGPAAAPASQDPQGPPGRSSHQDLRDASQWYWQVQPGGLPHHVHHLPPHVLDDLPEPGWGRPWRHCLSPAGLGRGELPWSFNPIFCWEWAQVVSRGHCSNLLPLDVQCS